MKKTVYPQRSQVVNEVFARENRLDVSADLKCPNFADLECPNFADKQ